MSSSERAPDLSVIVVSWNTRQLLANCLAAVCETLAGLSAEVFVVDNASRDGSARMVRAEFPAVRLIANDANVGFARANNQALAVARGRYALLLNSDTVVQPGALPALVDFADAHDQAGAVGGLLLNPDGSFQASMNDFPSLPSLLAEAFGLAQWLYRRPNYPSYAAAASTVAAECDWVGGACVLVRQKAIAQVGLLDESYFLNSEEVDWCWRLKRAGWQVWFTPAARVTHLGGASAARQSAEAKIQLWRGKIRFMRRHHGLVQAAAVGLACRSGALLKVAAYLMRYAVLRDQASQMHLCANVGLLSQRLR